jgi:hypothetical protein
MVARRPHSASAWLVLLSLAGVADAATNEPTIGFLNSRSPTPTEAAWSTTSSVSLERTFGAKARGCTVRLKAEWMRVRCPGLKTAAITQLGGNRAEVSYFIEPPGVDRVPGAGQVTFPVRMGERRAFLFWTLGPGYDGPLTVVPAVVLQAAWLAGAAEPSVTLSDALHEPVPTKTHPRVRDPKER